jgi:uncharacterized glyoxalase superfamily protein PhnB
MIVPILAVRDIDASVNFFVEKLGFSHDFSMQGPDGKNSFASVRLGTQVVIMLTLDPEFEKYGEGLDLVIYPPDDKDFDAFYADVQARGATIAEPLQDQYWGDRTFVLHDLNGYRLTFAQAVKKVPMEDIEAIMRSGGPQG